MWPNAEFGSASTARSPNLRILAIPPPRTRRDFDKAQLVIVQCTDAGPVGLRQRTVDPDAYPVGKGADDLPLNHKQIANLSIVEVGPEVAAGAGVDQLRVDLQPVSELLLAAFQHIVHAQIACDLADIGGLAPVLEARILGDHGIGLAARELGDHTFGDGIAQIALVLAGAVILERQNSDDGQVFDIPCGLVDSPDVGAAKGRASQRARPQRSRDAMAGPKGPPAVVKPGGSLFAHGSAPVRVRHRQGRAGCR